MSGWLCLQHNVPNTRTPSFHDVKPRWIRFIRALEHFEASRRSIVFTLSFSKSRYGNRRKMVLPLKNKRRLIGRKIIPLISSLSRYFGKVWGTQRFSNRTANEIEELGTKETKELIRRLVLFVETMEIERAFCVVDTELVSMARRLNVRGGGKVACSLRTRHVVSWLFMGRMNTPPSPGKLNNRGRGLLTGGASRENNRPRFLYLCPSTDFAQQDSR